MTLDEKVELIYDSYTRTLDYEISCLRADLAEGERELVDAHEGLQIRIKLFDAEVQEELIENMRELSKSTTESIRLQATLRLGQMIYKKRFKDSGNNVETIRPANVFLMGRYPDSNKE
jgi:hypothetical protein